jgi:DNA-binding XRE family transcriptional regulator
MGKLGTMTESRTRFDRPLRLTRRRPRSFTEWSALRRWGKLPVWEAEIPGFLLREARQFAGLTQRMLAERLDITQQAVSRAERWTSNPTINLMRRWLAICDRRLEIRVKPLE